MKLIENYNKRGELENYTLSDIVEDSDFHKSDIWIKNLEGRQNNTKYAPHSDIVLWIEDDGIAQFLRDKNANVVDMETDIRDENGDTIGTRIRHKVVFRAYPKMRKNRMGKLVPSPAVMTKTSSTGRFSRYDLDKIKEFDYVRHSTVDIVFEFYEYDTGHTIPKILEIWCEADEDSTVAGGLNPHLVEKYGYSEEDLDIPDIEEDPFD